MTEPSKIDAALATIAAGVKRLAKEDRNAHGGYQFAGIDDFLEMTGKLCASSGVSVLMDEEQCEVIPDFFSTKSGRVAALHMRFAFYLRCEGEQVGPYRRSIMVPSNMGSQAFGAGQSYALKQFLRATFQIPTGDKGEDINAHDTGTFGRSAASRSAARNDGSGEPRITAQQCAELRKLLATAGATEESFVDYLRCGTLPELPAARFASAKNALDKRINAQAPITEKEAA